MLSVLLLVLTGCNRGVNVHCTCESEDTGDYNDWMCATRQEFADIDGLESSVEASCAAALGADCACTCAEYACYDTCRCPIGIFD